MASSDCPVTKDHLHDETYAAIAGPVSDRTAER
jgi:hypothetical protein